jgi:hypothetical protein
MEMKSDGQEGMGKCLGSGHGTNWPVELVVAAAAAAVIIVVVFVNMFKIMWNIISYDPKLRPYYIL